MRILLHQIVNDELSSDYPGAFLRDFSKNVCNIQILRLFFRFVETFGRILNLAWEVLDFSWVVTLPLSAAGLIIVEKSPKKKVNNAEFQQLVRKKPVKKQKIV